MSEHQQPGGQALCEEPRHKAQTALCSQEGENPTGTAPMTDPQLPRADVSVFSQPDAAPDEVPNDAPLPSASPGGSPRGALTGSGPRERGLQREGGICKEGGELGADVADGSGAERACQQRDVPMHHLLVLCTSCVVTAVLGLPPLLHCLPALLPSHTTR